MKRYLNRAVALALLLLYTFSQLELIRATLGCTLDGLYPLWCAAICLCTWYTTCSRRGLLIGLPLSALLLFAAFRFYGGTLLPETNDLLDRITGAYMERFAYPGRYYAYTQAASDHSLLFVFMAFLFSSYMGAAITSHSGRLPLALICLLPFTAACLAVNLHPPVAAMLGLTLFVFLLVAGGKYAENSNSYLAVLEALLPVAVLLAALVFLVRPSEYRYDPEQVELNRRLKDAVQTADNWISERVDSLVLPYSDGGGENPPPEQPNPPQADSPIEGPDASDSMDLSRWLTENDLEQSFLTVRSTRSGSLYLRGASFGDYTGTGWTKAEEIGYGNALGFTAEALKHAGAEENEAQIRLLWNASCLYAPYFTDRVGETDDRLPLTGQSGYRLAYRAFPASFDGLFVPPELYETELAYREYAHAAYTRLPEGTRQTLLNLCAQAGLRSDSPDLITAVARYVQEGSVYDLETQPYPSDDYAVYFLTEARRGFCVHYATAAAALYRCLGVPARVTEGFLVYAEAGETVEARGADAHAWVEVYRDGLGWLPVEVTGQSGLDTGALGASEGESETQPTTEPTFAPAPPELTAEPLTETETQTMPENATPEPVQPTQPPVGLVTRELESEIGGGGVTAKGGSWLWLLPLALVLLAAAVPLSRLARRKLRQRRFAQEDTRKAAVAVYRCASDAQRYGVAIPESVRVCAEKAAFSPHPITPEELAGAREALDATLRKAYGDLKWYDKLRFKYLSALL